MSLRNISFVAFGFATTLAMCQSASIVSLGQLPGATSIIVTGMSADGGKVVGWDNTAVIAKSFSWTPDGGLVAGGRLASGRPTFFNGISPDGSTVVGDGMDRDGVEHAIWTQNDATIHQLPETGPYLEASAIAASRQARVIVGSGHVTVGVDVPLMWTDFGTPVSLGTLNPGESAWARGVSGDGMTVVGQSGYHAFRWRSGSGMVDISSSDPTRPVELAVAASNDGRVIVGRKSDISYTDRRALVWTEGFGVQDLGLIPAGTYSDATAVSADGSLVVGIANGWTGVADYVYDPGFLWTKDRGMVGIGDLLYQAGLQHEDNFWSGIVPNGVAHLANGTIVITGTAMHSTEGTVGFYAVLPAVPEPGTWAGLSLLSLMMLRRRSLSR